MAAQFGYQPEDLEATYLVVKGGRALIKSDASLALLGELENPWPWFRLLRFVPRPIRDSLYDVVARNRLRWFGEQSECSIPAPEQRHRFLD